MAKLRVFTAFSGYDSQCMALDLLGIDYELVGWSDIDPNAIKAHNAVYPQWADRNYGDISKIDWSRVPDFDLFTYSSPCFVAGTWVLTSKGYKPIESIEVGDSVLTHSNSYCEVERVGHKLSSDLYHIRGMMFDDIICTGEHPFYVRKLYRQWDNSVRCYRRFFQDPQWVNAKDLAKDTYLGYAINTKSELPTWVGSIDNRWGHHKSVNKLQSLLDKSAFWYVMGRYVGDGWKHTNKTYGSGVVICCSNRNYDSLVAALNELGLHFSQSNERTVIKLHISMNEIHAFVDRYGYYAHGKKIDAETLNLPVALLKSFIDGVLDSDGCFTHNEYKVTSVSRELIYGLQQCIAKVYHRPVRMYKTVRSRTTVIEGRVVNQRDSYTLVWHPDKRKQDKAFYENGYVWFPIQSINRQEGVDVVYNIQVRGDHSYTANGAIVHNCQDFSFGGLQLGGEEGSGTRSSLLWECQKAIMCKKPKFLLMENVKALVSDKFYKTYQKWDNFLMRSGYRTYSEVLNAKDYGVPQSRERIFNVSIRDDGSSSFYGFPARFPLQVFLRDVLEDKVPESYYLSGTKVKGIFSWLAIGDGLLPVLRKAALAGGVLVAGGRSVGRTAGDPKERVSRGGGSKVQTLEVNGDSSVSNTLTSFSKDNYIISLGARSMGAYDRNRLDSCRVEGSVSRPLELAGDGSYSPTLSAMERGTNFILQVAQLHEDAGRLFKNPHRGRVYSPEGCAPTLSCMQGGNLEPKILESYIMTPVRTEYGKQMHKAHEGGELKASRHDFTELCPRPDGVSNTLISVYKDNYVFTPLFLGTFMGDIAEVCVVEDFKDELVLAARFGSEEWFLFWVRVRKLTPRECFRLMGVRESNIDSILGCGVAKTKLYGLAGNSIVVDVLAYIFAELFHFNELRGEFIFDKDLWSM